MTTLLDIKTTCRRVTVEYSPRHVDGSIVIITPRGRLRLYLGHSGFPRGRVSRWRAYRHDGIVLRLHTDARKQHVVGAQWRPPRAHDMR